MNGDCWIPVDLAPELAPLAEEYDRRAADADDAEARRDALDFNAENRARRLALQEAYADGGADAAAELPVPLTEEERKVLVARAEAHVAAAKAALYAFNEQAVQAVREHAPQIKADLTTSRASAEAEREDAERVLAEAESRAKLARARAGFAQRTEQWIDSLCAGKLVLRDRPAFFTAKRHETPLEREARRRHQHEADYLAGRTRQPFHPNVEMVPVAPMPAPSPAPVGLVEVNENSTPEEAEEAAQANAAATKAGIEALDAAGVGYGGRPNHVTQEAS